MKSALISGASRGIGKSIAIRLAKSNINVAINYNGSKEKAEEVAKQCRSYGVKAITIQGNVANVNDVQEMINKTLEEFESLDIVVNNAGITKDGLLLRMKEEDFDSVIDVNLKGTFNMVKAASKIMMKQKSGVIINMSSVVGLAGNAGQANYAASKAGVIGLSKAAAKELASRGIRVNVVAPGYIQSDMTDVLSDAVKENVINNIPLKRMGQPEDIANMVNFLVSEEASYITGQVFQVDGGMLI